MEEKLQETLLRNERTMDSVYESTRLLEDYNIGIASRLKPKLHELKREGDSKISLANEKCTCFIVSFIILYCLSYFL